MQEHHASPKHIYYWILIVISYLHIPVNPCLPITYKMSRLDITNKINDRWINDNEGVQQEKQTMRKQGKQNHKLWSAFVILLSIFLSMWC